MSQSSRNMFVKAYVLSRLNYMSVTYSTLPNYHKYKIHKLIMTSARISRGNYGFKVSCTQILLENKMLNLNQTLYKAAITFIVKIMESKRPLDIYSLIKIPKRLCSPIHLICPPMTCHSKKFNYLPFLIDMYNKIDQKIKSHPIKKQLKIISNLTRLCPHGRWLEGQNMSA